MLDRWDAGVSLATVIIWLCSDCPRQINDLLRAFRGNPAVSSHDVESGSLSGSSQLSKSQVRKMFMQMWAAREAGGPSGGLTGGARPSSCAATPPYQRFKYYIIAIGWIPGIYRNWGACLNQILGYSHPRFKGFNDWQEPSRGVSERVGSSFTSFRLEDLWRAASEAR